MTTGAKLEEEQFTSPITYEDWLNCFDMLKIGATIDREVIHAIANGSFINRGYIAIVFQQRLVETINEMLNNRVAKFSKDLNLLISLNELSDIFPLFVKLRREINNCLFFNGFKFLDEDVKYDLETSIKEQMQKFWCDTILFLKKQTLDGYNSDLEDSLFLIQRLILFPSGEKAYYE